jgi:hypothetical protein
MGKIYVLIVRILCGFLGVVLVLDGGLPWSWHTHSVNCFMMPILFIPVLTAAGLGCFWLFYKSVSFFDHI